MSEIQREGEGGLGFWGGNRVNDFGGEGGDSGAGRAHYYYMIANFYV